MAVDEIRIGVIGVGAIGPSHIYSIGQVPGCRLSAVCDIREDAANRVAGEQGVAAFTDVESMLTSGEVDAVTVSTPSGFHLESVISALEHDTPVLVEKPLEITTERIDRIIAAEKSSKGFVAGVYQSRFRPLVRTMRGLIDQGLLGELYSGSCYIKRYRTQDYYDSGGWRGTWKVDGGGCLMNQGIHEIDLYRWFMGDPKEVIAVTETKGRDVEVETLALGIVRFSSGAAGVIEATTLAYPEYKPYIELVGERGTVAFTHSGLIRMDIIDPTPAEIEAKNELEEYTRAHDAAEAARKRTVAAGTAVPHVDMGHTPVVADFVEAIRDSRAPFVSATEARKAVALITAIYQSSREGGAPVHPL